ncbi:MAG: hypothetical protein JXC32_13695 [Anaerolineae bacterium]|nr:hypothetical protein [Anaerolineae bacterium]
MKAELKPRYGQVLVIVALGLLALLAFVALAIDIGGVYQERRAMQNAADAGALAGAREMCQGTATTAIEKQAAAWAVAWDYTVNRNRAAGAQITVTVPTTVTVVATHTFDTYFAGLLGFDEIPVAADATAVCGESEAVGDLWPVAFDVDRWRPVSNTLECGDIVIIWQGDSEFEQIDCRTGDGDAGFDCCHVYANKNKNQPDPHWDLGCEAGSWTPEIYPFDRAAWVDFTAGLSEDHPDPCDAGTGVGADEIKYRVRGYDQKGDACTPFLTVPDCYAGSVGSGLATSGWNTAAAIDDGRVVRIPLYDPDCSSPLEEGEIEKGIVCGYPEAQAVDGECTIIDENSGGNERVWITNLLCLQIGICVDDEGCCDRYYDEGCHDEDWITTGYLWEYDEENETVSTGNPVIIATIPCVNGEVHPGCFTSAGYTTGDPVRPGGVPAVNLVD